MRIFSFLINLLCLGLFQHQAYNIIVVAFFFICFLAWVLSQFNINAIGRRYKTLTAPCIFMTSQRSTLSRVGSSAFLAPSFNSNPDTSSCCSCCSRLHVCLLQKIRVSVRGGDFNASVCDPHPEPHTTLPRPPASSSSSRADRAHLCEQEATF